MRAIVSYGVAGAIVIVGALWLGSGVFVAGGNGPGNGEKPIISFFSKDAEGAETTHHVAEGAVDPHLTIAERVAESSGASAPAQSVRTETYKMQAMPVEVPLRGRTKAKTVTTITPETSGVVTAVNVTKGQSVKPGDIICTLEEGTRAAAVAQAEAALAQAQTAYDSNKALRDKGLAANNTGIAAESALRQAQTAFDQAKQEFDRAKVTTKVAGVVQDPVATVGSVLSPGQPCATVVELDPMLFVASVPEARIARAELGLAAKVETVTGQTVEGKVSYIASLADDATRSFPVEIEIPNADGKVLSGVTATAMVTMGTVPAHLLPQSVLTLNDEGTLGIRSVKDGVVEFYPVTIISDSREGVWVTGLPPSVDVITMGQEYVVPGQKVNATNVSGKPESVEAETAAEGVHS
ncbi:MAG TPA: efflux RND transporter periplasmic adaptor subunit [Devosia sp.]|jgi:multidrug efflux system membrane fusion protein|uniref:efflux RND transporter periplasmic adaptor subunit n=1 Tax=Devosia sp. TaxID=1871048 RepID=UPI002DDD7FE9|nr:efflux RND transporter periplasmic adaptor subunit [Devosia sp.]HEV2514129.1 efflux RND transporter periplasmic adaptor subunit [Devosia sp.]